VARRSAIQEALALAEPDLDYRRGSLLVRRGKGGRRREVGMDEWGWEHLRPWLELRVELSVGAVLRPERPDPPASAAACRSAARAAAPRPAPPAACA
jgi:integrase